MRGQRGGRRLPGYDSLVVLALAAVGFVPLLAVGLVVSLPIQRALDDETEARMVGAVATARTTLQRSATELDALVTSYADWPTLRALVRDGDTTTIQRDVLAFLVTAGSADGGFVALRDGTLVSDALGHGAVPPGGTAGGPTGVPPTAAHIELVDGRLVQVASRPVLADDGTEVARLTLIRRIDSRFAAEVHRLTGFEVTVLDPSGAAVLYTDESVARLLTDGPDRAPDPGAVASTRLAMPLGDGENAEIVLTAELATLPIVDRQLPGLIIAITLVMGSVTGVMALALARVLRRRLAHVHDGLAAVAEGRAPVVALPSSGRDELARVARGVEHLVATLERRERILRRALSMASALPSDRPVDEVAASAASATIEVFTLAACRIVDPGGRTVGDVRVGESRDPRDGRTTVVEAPLDLATGAGHLVGELPPGGAWTDGEHALFEVMAVLVGVLLRDAERYDTAVRASRRLGQVNTLQREFVRGVSHSLQSPLTALELASEDLIDGTRDDAFLSARAQIVRSETRRLAQQVAEILTLSRLDAGTVRLDPEALSPTGLVRRAWSHLGTDRALEVVDEAPGAFALADPAALRQAIGIVLDNADRYAPEGPIRATVSLAPRVPPAAGREAGRGAGGDTRRDAAPTWLRIVVEDAGPGIPAAERERVFRRFVRGSTSTGTDGLGLGLGVARSLLRAMDGDVRAGASGLGGAAFTMSVPVATEPLPDAVPGPAGTNAA